MHETNLLSLIRPWLDTIYQITTKKRYSSISQKVSETKQPLVKHNTNILCFLKTNIYKFSDLDDTT
jgi:hypothetical protein